MDISKEQIDDLNAVITIKVGATDYQEPVDNVLRNYKKQANVPGFRKGHVPMGMIKKMYGKAVLVEELNKILQQNLSEYITKEEIKYLGNPLPKEEEPLEDVELGQEFSFSYELGLAPSFEVGLNGKLKFSQYKISIDQELIDKYKKDLARRYGSIKNIDKSGEEDLLGVTLTEVNDKGEPIEGGITNNSTISIEYIADDKTKKQFVGVEKDAEVTVSMDKLNKSDGDTAQMLNISQAKAEKLTNKFLVKVTAVHELTPATINQELFDKLYGPDAVKSETEFEEKIKEELEKNLSVDADKKLRKDINDKLMDKLKITLPQGFLKKWLKKTNEKVTDDMIEEEFELYEKSLKMQLIENQIIKENNIEVKPEEAMDYTKGLVSQQMSMYGQGDMDDEQLTQMAAGYLQKEEEGRQIYEQIFDKKLMDLYKDVLSLKETEVSFDEFVKLATGKESKGKILDTLGKLVNFK